AASLACPRHHAAASADVAHSGSCARIPQALPGRRSQLPHPRTVATWAKGSTGTGCRQPTSKAVDYLLLAMKAAVNSKYGPPVDVVHILDVENPVPKDNEVLIKVHAASVNPIDALGNGPPYVIRPMIGLRKPKDTRVGYDAAGRVEAVGRSVT